METFFGPNFFSANRAKLQQATGNDTVIVITGNGAMQRTGDEPYKFYQDSSFWYLTGLDTPDLTLVITPADTYLIVPVLSFERQAFDGAIDPAACAARSGITTVLEAADGWAQLKRDLAAQTTIATTGTLPSHMKRHGLYALPFRRRLIDKLKRLRPGISVRDIRPELTALRCIKQPEELQALRRAIDITTDTLQEIVQGRTLAAATHEYQLEAAIGYGFRMRGASDHAFSPIVGAGAHATTLHHVHNDGPIAADDLIVLDVGADVEHYSADITRTISKQLITGRKAEVFRAVCTVQDYACSLIKPGTLPTEYERAIEAFMGEQLRALGVISTTDRADIRRYFPHATSHFLGLDTHDAGDYRQPWQAGMVITCEPGIYIPEEGIGVRIEDDFLITTEGCEQLGAGCPRELTDVQ